MMSASNQMQCQAVSAAQCSTQPGARRRQGKRRRRADVAAWKAALPLLALCGSLLALVGCGAAEPPATEPAGFVLPRQVEPERSALGMVVSGHELASRAGAQVLEQGGNAIDAAVATGFALAAVLPRAGNIGGGGFLVYRSAAGDVRALDFRETAPGAASRDMYLDENGELTDGSVIGALAAGVPGSVAGLWEMHRELGTLPWEDLVAPAIELARGHTLDEVRHGDIAEAAAELASFPGSASQFLRDGEPPPAGSRFEQPDLARTLTAVAERGPDGFYRGEVADLVVAEMERSHGIITHADLESYQAVWRDPVATTYRGYELVSMPPPSSGGVTLGELLNVLEGYEPLPAFGTADLVALEVEAMRRAFLDRNHYLGDPDFVAMPLERLLSKSYAAELRAAIDPERATPTAPLYSALREGTETTHYSVVDGAGNAAAVTTTLNFSFGAKVTVTGAGFLLNNEMDDFAAAPGKPNQFGLVQGEANSVQPAKRMLSSMTPTIVTDGQGEVRLVVGSPGGPTIITTVFHVISNVLDHDMSLAEAVAAPRLHHQALPDIVFFEAGGLSAETQKSLVARGYTLDERSGYSGNVSAIERSGSEWVGVADPRRNGGAAAPRSIVAAEREVAQLRATGSPR